MLKEWILHIKKRSHLFCSDEWKYRVSGNVADFSVEPQLLKKHREYRCAVITIGQILKELTIKIEKSGSGYHIQSFQNLEAPEIIASIRIVEQAEYSKDPFPVLEEEIFDYSGEEKLRSITKKYQFDIVQADQPLKMSLNLKSFENKSWYVMTSKHDNPFTWLNLGSWKTSMQSNGQVIPNGKSIFIFEFCSPEEWERIKLSFPVKDHLQAVIAIPD
tara:strand:- start:15308 stop:15958 length:651 start_codon:yes stop_codon:yes gene_type:complete